MERYSLQEAQEHLKDLIHEALHGKTVLIVGEANEEIQLVPLTPPSDIPKKRRKAGSARGLIKMADDFDAPLDDFKDYME